MSVSGQQLKVSYAYKQFAESIRNQVLAGSLKPGERLPSEAELAELFGVTRSTIREGLRQLEQSGLVYRPSPRRLEIAAPKFDKITAQAGQTLTLLDVTFRELWLVAMQTEPLAAGLAAKAATAQECGLLQDIHTQMVAARGDQEATVALDTQFHTLVAKIGKNRALSLAREPIALLLFQGFTQLVPAVPQSFERQIDAHAHILVAIRNHDVAQAESWARKHIADFWRGVEIAGLQDAVAIQQKGSTA